MLGLDSGAILRATCDGFLLSFAFALGRGFSRRTEFMDRNFLGINIQSNQAAGRGTTTAGACNPASANRTNLFCVTDHVNVNVQVK
jgi:hypothetical protein